jgi:hypothetical protein
MTTFLIVPVQCAQHPDPREYRPSVYAEGGLEVLGS